MIILDILIKYINTIKHIPYIDSKQYINRTIKGQKMVN